MGYQTSYHGGQSEDTLGASEERTQPRRELGYLYTHAPPLIG